MALRTPMKKTQFGSRDLLANGGGCPVEVSFRLFLIDNQLLFLL
jgi:hypothetical protein